ncbi:vacuolar sorting-associated 16 homolog [Pelobates cultripes]|uniref:Vacuolar protein sorting-associated protein 16 homolog n=2 Tax=Pelobates cultripes TaxID=61616 RepID=A0AAD1WEZ5_PELCU|nr:vacuolar sorting-associated 16 homolog [Pelobates cultripes]
MEFYTADWYPLGTAYYRKFDLYRMEWNLKEDLKDCLVAVGPYGGSIALMRNLSKEKPSSSRPVLEIYSASGVLLSSILWKSGQVVHLGWTVTEDLLCIQDDGTVLIYDIFCEFKRHFSMGNEVKQNQVLEAKVFHSEYRTGIAILTSALTFTLTSNIDELKLRRMPEISGSKIPPTCWAVLFQDRVTLVLVAVDKDLYLLDNTTCSVLTLPGISPMAGAYLQMSVSFNYKHIALFTDTGYMWFGKSSLKEKLCEFISDNRTAPKQMAWCIRPHSKHVAVAVMWDSLLLVAGKAKEGISTSIMVPELDGVRILSQSAHEFLHEIPRATEEIFKIASMAPGALLLVAQKEYEKESQKSDDYLREIKDQNLLSIAVEKCIEAAGYEHAPEIQKSLLRAASFGKCFVDKYCPTDFVTMCHDLRVLNAIHDYQIGIPLSITQYKQLTVQVLLDRLVLRRLYPLAVKICKYLKLSDFQGVSRVLAHWACYKVQQKEKSDEEVAQAINQKLGDTPGISYSEIASKACDCGRTELAIKLLEYEPKSEDQVPLLLKMKRCNLALSKAIESGDTDLVYTVVSYMKHEFNRGDFFMTLQNHPIALSLYRQFCKHQEPETLKDLYNQDDNHQELGNYFVRSSFSSEKSVEGRVAELQNAADEYNKAKNELAAKFADNSSLILTQTLKEWKTIKNHLNIDNKIYDKTSMESLELIMTDIKLKNWYRNSNYAVKDLYSKYQIKSFEKLKNIFDLPAREVFNYLRIKSFLGEHMPVLEGSLGKLLTKIFSGLEIKKVLSVVAELIRLKGGPDTPKAGKKT